MISSQDELEQELKQYYTKLLDEVLESVDHTGEGRRDTGSIPDSTANLIKNLIEKVTGQIHIISRKSVSNYYRDGYSKSLNLIGLFAAVSLVKIYKEVAPEECVEFYADKKPSARDYWEQYVDRSRNQRTPVVTPEYSPVTTQWESQDNAEDPLKVFPSPDYGEVYHRSQSLDRLFQKICQHRLVVIDGIAGCGKKHLVKSIESKLIDSAKYRYIWWIPLHKNYSLDNFFDDLPLEVDPSVKGVTGKIQWLDEQLKSNGILIVFFDIGQGELNSFLPLIRNAFDKQGDCRYLVIRDSMSLFADIPSVNWFLVTPYTNTEIKGFFQMNRTQLSLDDIPRIAQLTGGWPYYLYAVRKSWGNEHTREEIFTSRILNTHLGRWFTLWSGYAGPKELELLQACVFYGMRLTYDEVSTLADMLGIIGTDEVLTLLQQSHLIVQHHGEVFAPTHSARTLFYFHPSSKSRAKAQEAVAVMLEASITKTNNYKLIEKEIDRYLGAIEHYQQAGKFDKSGALLDSIRPHLKRLNKFPVLISLQSRQVQKETEKKHWYILDLAHGYFVTGQYKECLFALNQCIQHAFTWYAENTRNTDGVSFYIKVFQLFAELCNSSGRNKEAISIFSDVLSLFDYAELNWVIRCHSITTLSAFYEDSGNTDKALKMNNNLLTENYGHSAIAEGVICMRLAMIFKQLGNHPMKREFLEQASTHFRKGQDKRALAWVQSFWAIDHLFNRDMPKAELMIGKVLRTQRTGNLANGEYLRWLKFIHIKIKKSSLAKLIGLELARVEKLEQTKNDAWQNRLAELIGYVANKLKYHSKVFDIDSFIKPLSGNDIPLNSELSRSMEKRVLNRPLKFLEKVAVRDSATIFDDLNITLQIKSCASVFECQHFLKQEIIFKHFAQLCDQSATSDQIRLEFAKILFSLKEYVKTIELLTHITLANQKFTYLLLKADCYRRLNRIADAEGYYELALLAVTSGQEEAYVKYNQARLAIECKDNSKFEDALSWSEQALNLNGSDPEFVKNVIDTIVFLSIQLSPHQQVVITMQRLVELYAISESRVESIIQSVENIPKRDMLLRNMDVFKRN